MKEEFLQILNRFKLDFYRNMNSDGEENGLTVSESFCLEVINGLKEPTVRDVALFMKISQPNAAYKISNLERKGFITKEQSKEDKRVYYLRITDQYDDFKKSRNKNISKVLDILEEKIDDSEKAKIEKFLVEFYDSLPTPEELI